MRHHNSVRSILAALSLVVLFVAGCHKKQFTAPAPPPAAAAAPAQPTASLSADRTSIIKGESIQLSWTTADAVTVSITPGVGPVTAQGSTTVTPTDSTTYTLIASNDGGVAASGVQIMVITPAPIAMKPGFEDLFSIEVQDAFFDYDKADIRPDAEPILRHDADFLKDYPNARVIIEGYCDERGTTEYNLALGQRRANAVKEYLVSLGVPADNLVTTSYGKEKQFCADHGESCWEQNRRGHLVTTQEQAAETW